MTKQYLREAWYAPTPAGIKKGDYVLASKYRDGDPGDQFCIGFYDSSFGDGTGMRHLVIDSEGQAIPAQWLPARGSDRDRARQVDGREYGADREDAGPIQRVALASRTVGRPPRFWAMMIVP